VNEVFEGADRFELVADLGTPLALSSSSCAVMPSGVEETSIRVFKLARNMPVQMPSELIARRKWQPRL